MNNPHSIDLEIRRFLITQQCPSTWKSFDLYLFRDNNVVFYIGQSECAFSRVWDHIMGGVHGHSIIGRFILTNWPKSGLFHLELINSLSPDLNDIAKINDSLERRCTAERKMIEEYSPCLNVALNNSPVSLPPGYALPNASIKWVRSYKRMIHEAAYSILKDDNLLKWD